MTIYVILILCPLFLGLWAQIQVQSKYSHWSKVKSSGGITGAEAAEAVMQQAGITDVSIVSIRGKLTDHYDPLSKRLALSEENYYGTSLAALGVAAHEAGHAIQHKQAYAPLQWRSALVPVTNVACQILPFVILGGFILNFFGLIKVAVWIYMLLTLFQLITLPVEFDASARAKKILVNLAIVNKQESRGVCETLNAAALTYVAAFVASLGNLMYYLLLISRGRDE
ncbi:MAG: zinc metallopeptidase [Puniceicoccales bacterium]|jgi:Zn-dependent membrane protease YugP|nr:zinc metallopeptidase [Puniceicoccales bacterium]